MVAILFNLADVATVLEKRFNVPLQEHIFHIFQANTSKCLYISALLSLYKRFTSLPSGLNTIYTRYEHPHFLDN